MRAGLFAFAIVCGSGATRAFVPSSSTHHVRSHSVCLDAQQFPSFLDKLPEIPNPFGALKTSDAIPSVRSLDDDQQFDPSPSGLFRQAKRVIAADMGIQEPGLLDENFKWYGPVVDDPLGKIDYLAAGRFFDLRSSFPDLDYRAHDFRLDEQGASTVRLTCRVTGTMRGELRLRGEVLSPTGKTMKCPPEAVTMTFDLSTGKVTKIVSGFALDRLLGNTDGATGVIAAALVGGKKVSDWELYPAPTVLQRIFGRPVKQLPEPNNFLAPFPETVMVQRAKGILAANMASEDSSLLAKSFMYTTPLVGPVRKKEFLEKYAPMEFEGVDPSFDHFRVDPYNPNVVWVDVRPSASGYKGSPQAMSFTFDDDGFCTRITSGAIIDPTVGNGGGLAGIEGYKYAMGTASPAIVTRPLPRALGRVRRRFVGLMTGDDVDNAVVSKPSTTPVDSAPLEELSSLRAKAAAPIREPSPPNSPPLVAPKAPPKQSVTKPKPSSATSEQPNGFSLNLPTLPKLDLNPKPSQTPKTTEPKPSLQDLFKLPGSLSLSQSVTQSPPSKKKTVSQSAQQQAAAKAVEEKRRKEATQKLQEKQRIDAQKAEAQRKLEESKAAAMAARLKQEEKRKQDAIAKQKEEQAKKEALAKQKELAEAQRQQAAALKQKELAAKEAAATATRTKTEEQRKAVSPAAKQKALEDKQKQTEEQILSKLSQVTSRATIGLFGFGATQADDDDEPVTTTKSTPVKASSKAPFGVPTLSKWRKNFDGSITGIISGSNSFGDGEKVTTSAIAKGSIADGEVVVTASGSKYFLS